MYNNYLKNNGQGIYTVVTIPAQVPICEISGDLYTKENIKHADSEITQVGLNTYLGPSGGITDYINHSCNPNAYLHIVGHRVILYSLYVINADSEITIDYSLNSTDSPHEWQMICKCKSNNCRKIISGYYHLDESTRQLYLSKNIVPMFITTPIFMRK